MITRLLALLLCVSTSSFAAEHAINAIKFRNYESMFFEPDHLEVEPGDTVTFVVDDRDHQPQSVFIPAGASSWQAKPGQPITVTLTEQGVYLFDCAYHNVMGMAGVIVVGEPVNLAEARRFFARYREETFAMSRDRLDHIWDPDGLLDRSASSR